MRNFIDSTREKLRRFLSGRYGFDELSRLLSIWAMALMLPGCIPGLSFFGVLSLALWLWLLFRALSRHLEKRRAERNAYLRRRKSCSDRWYIRRQAWLLRSSHRFYRCKQCKTYVRVPRGKGKIRITCPKCGNQFIKKT